MNEITQISIYLKEEAERVNEVALFQPLRFKSRFERESTLSKRKWNYTSNLGFFDRLSLKVQSFLFKYLPSVIPTERLTAEAKFKTVLALLLAQEEMRDYFLKDPERKQKFLKCLKEAALEGGYVTFPDVTAAANTPLKIARKLTQIEGSEESLIDNPTELNLQMAALSYQQRCEILYSILSRIERPPITSVLEVTSLSETHAIPLTTQYAQYKILNYDASSGALSYSYVENHATCSIKTASNSRPDAKGTMNQRTVVEEATQKWISSYCGELTTPFHVMEQILLLLQQKRGQAHIYPNNFKGSVEEKKILFTSLYSWDEFSFITDERAAIRKWDQKILESAPQTYKLHLLYFNIPFNALNKYPTPAEIKANMQDINDEAFICLLFEAWEKLNLESAELTHLGQSLLALKREKLSFIQREKAVLEIVDHFKGIKKLLLEKVRHVELCPFTQAINALLSEKKPDGKELKGIDKLLYLDYIAQELGYLHNKNCQNATDRSAGADAADKAQFAYQKIYSKPFLPGYESEEERAFFNVLYSMYLVWEEPEINTWLSTGFIGEKFYNNFIQKNPETTRYLVRWLRKNPEMYLGLSHYRK